MHVTQLVLREMRYRWFGTALAMLSVAAAVATIIGVLLALNTYDARTEELARQRQREVQATMGRLQEDFRKLTLKMGFTTVIVHQSQDLGDLFSKGYATAYMPEEYGDRLAAKKVATLNHVLPTLQQRMAWPERSGVVVQLIGVKGEVYIQSKNQVPLLDAVPTDGVVIGQQIQKSQNLKVGDEIVFADHKLKVAGIRPGRGGSDDVGLWVNLPLAQSILSKPNQINAIMAVECNCIGDRVEVIKREVLPILPDVQIFEFSDVAAFRSDSRKRVSEAAARAADEEKNAREAGRKERETLVRVLVPVSAAASAVWVGLLLLGNARDRRGEVGILRAIGVRGWQVAAMFVAKAMVVAVIGLAIGLPLGVWVGGAVKLPFTLAATIAGGALVLAVIASLAPATLAARSDPANMLRDE